MTYPPIHTHSLTHLLRGQLTMAVHLRGGWKILEPVKLASATKYSAGSLFMPSMPSASSHLRLRPGRRIVAQSSIFLTTGRYKSTPPATPSTYICCTAFISQV